MDLARAGINRRGAGREIFSLSERTNRIRLQSQDRDRLVQFGGVQLRYRRWSGAKSKQEVAVIRRFFEGGARGRT